MSLLTQKNLTHFPLQNSNGLLSTARAMVLLLVLGLIFFLIVISNLNLPSRFLASRNSPKHERVDVKWEVVRSSGFAHAAALDQVVLTGKDEGWALTWAELSKVQDNGKTWTPILSNDQPGRKLSAFYSFTFTSPEIGFVVGTQEKGSGHTALILKTTDGGDTWEERPTDVRLESDLNLSPRLQSVSFCNQNTGWAVGGDLILHTTDGGESWQQQQSYLNKGERLLTVACVNSERALAVGTGGLLLQTSNGGDTWMHQDLGTKEFLTRVRFFGDKGWIVGGAQEKGLLFRTYDGGNTWKQQKLNPSTGLLYDIFFLGSNGWIAARNGTLLRSEDGGETWSRQEVPTTESLTSLYFLSPTQGWIGGDKLTLLRLASDKSELNQLSTSVDVRLEEKNTGSDKSAEGPSVRNGIAQPRMSNFNQTAAPTTQLVEYVWKNKNQQLGKLLVPPGYREETMSYAEGVRTTLTYPDGSYLILHIGGMIKLPFFSEPEHQVSEWRKLANRVVREGKVRKTELLWREENSYGVWPPTNLGFTNVPRSRVKMFEDALASFKRGS